MRSDPYPEPAAMRTALPATLVALVLALSACSSSRPKEEPSAAPADGPLRWGYVPDVEVSDPPFSVVHANWKQRVDQAYVYVEHTGHYSGTGPRLASVYAAMEAQGLQPSGPPFALYYDDPGTTPTGTLRSRACAPVDGPAAVEPPLQYAVLRGQTVVYALASGPYPDVPRVYPALFEYLTRMSWVEDGPIREVYLVPPARVREHSELLTEVQVPARPAR